MLLNFFSPCLCHLTETDDYAEIVDEEDTYTMPSSKYLQLSPSKFIRINLNSRHCICLFAVKESYCIIKIVSGILIPPKNLLSGKHSFRSVLLPVSNKDQRSSMKLRVVTSEPSRSL